MRFFLDNNILLRNGPSTKVYHGTFDAEPIAAKTTGTRDVLAQEAGFLQRCNHPNVVKIKGLVMLRDDSYLIMELALGGNLRESLGQKKFSRPQKLSLVRQVCLGLEHIHSLRILHRDIRAENLLLKNDQHLLIADFAMAQEFREGPQPVNYHDIVKDSVYTFKSDVFLLALVVFQLFEDRRNVDRSELATEIQKQSSEVGLNKAIFDVALWERTIMDALHWRPERRPTVAVFRQAFSGLA